MLVRISNNSFVRCTDKYGYITNQLTRHDRTYSETGSVFLSYLSRKPQDVDDIVNELLKEFYDVDKKELNQDFIDFIKDLAESHFVVIGQTEKELYLKDKQFSYADDNPKTLNVDFTQTTRENVSLDTQSFFLEKIQGRPLISALQLELTSKCNERCIHCYIPNEKKNHGINMPFNEVVRIIDQFAKMGGIWITLSGGEIFMYPYLLEVMEYCRQKDLQISLLSNLINLKDEYIARIKAVNVSLIQVSLYSMNSEIHDFITTVKGSFDRTKMAIEKLVANDIPVQISCPIMKANKNGYRDVLKYAQSLKIKAQADYIMMARSDLDVSNLANRLSLEETDIVIRDIIEHDIDYRETNMKQRPVSDDIKFDYDRFIKQPVCGVGYDNCCVAANGDVYPCAGWQHYILGNAFKQSLQNIWEGEKTKYLRTITEESFPECLKCEARDFCARCLVRNYNESNGDMFKISKHFCDVAFLNKRLVEEYKEKGFI